MIENKQKLVLYTTPTCPHCKRAKIFLSENGLQFVEYDVLNDANARREMITKSGQMGVPVLIIGDDVLIGFDPEAISNKLGLNK